MKIAVTTFVDFHTDPDGPELQVKQILEGPFMPRK